MLEVVVAMMILSLGIAGMAGTSAVVVKQTVESQTRNKKTAAARTVSEQLRSIPFDSVRNGDAVVGQYRLNWVVTSSSFRAKRLQIVAEGIAQGQTTLAVLPADTFHYTVLR